MHEVNSLWYRLVPAIVIALLCHLMALLALGRYDWLPEPPSRQTLKVSVTVADHPATTEPTAPEAAPAPQPEIPNPQTETPVPFRVPDELPERRQSFRSPAADTSWVDGLFSARESRPDTPAEDQEQEPAEQEPQVLTEKLPILGSYHQQLIQILARRRYHDDQYSFTRLTRHHKVVLNLVLHPSGALLRADIRQSSGDSALDAAAQRSAYAASPFPPPPASDADINFSYPVEIQYQPR